MTSLPASVFGMTDRGVIRPGAFADLVIFDPAAVSDTATYAEPQKLAEGVSDVLVNGVPVRARWQVHGCRAGKSPEKITQRTVTLTTRAGANPPFTVEYGNTAMS